MGTAQKLEIEYLEVSQGISRLGTAQKELGSWKLSISTVSAGIIERKLRSTKVRLFTVPCCSIILFSSEGIKKNVSEFTPNFFRRSIILVRPLSFYNSVFLHFSHMSHFRSIINFPRSITNFAETVL